jgi:hypothetical protein
MMKTLLISATAMALAAPALAQVTAPSAPAAPPASAQPTTPTPPPSSSPQTAAVDFTKVDADKSGAVSIAELKVADAMATQSDFDKYDADKSKSLSKAEIDKWAMAKKSDKGSAPGQ